MEKPNDLPPPYSATQQPGVHQLPFTVPPPGYTPYDPPPPAPGFVPHYGATTTHVVINPPIIAVGGCPACRIGILEDEFTCLGVFCAIFFFPLGILCCLALKNRRCANCGAYFG